MRIRNSIIVGTIPLAVVTLICATAGTVAAQTQTSPQTQTAPQTQTLVETTTVTSIRLPDGGLVIIFPGKGGSGQIYRTNVTCTGGVKRATQTRTHVPTSPPIWTDAAELIPQGIC